MCRCIIIMLQGSVVGKNALNVIGVEEEGARGERGTGSRVEAVYRGKGGLEASYGYSSPFGRVDEALKCMVDAGRCVVDAVRRVELVLK
jgi:hypothetical protein